MILLMFHKPGKEPTILKSNDYLPNNLSDYQWDFSLCVPPSQENIEKIIETPTTDKHDETRSKRSFST